MRIAPRSGVVSSLPLLLLGLALPVLGLLAAPVGEPPSTLAARPADVGSIDAIVRASYDAVSGDSQHAPDLERFGSLFLPEAQLIDATDRDGRPATKVRSIEEFLRVVGERVRQHPRIETEVARRTETYGNMAQVWSTYEVRSDRGETEPEARGINSIQLFNDGQRWWIVGALWKNETPGQPVPADYLPSQP